MYVAYVSMYIRIVLYLYNILFIYVYTHTVYIDVFRLYVYAWLVICWSIYMSIIGAKGMSKRKSFQEKEISMEMRSQES